MSSGNELDLDMADYINFLVDDDHTKVIACMAEGVRRPDALMAAAQRAFGKVRRRTVGAEAPVSTRYHAVRALCRQADDAP